ncbi:hypothetical protein [Shewanella pealeana]|uniref:Uncharacterized protein n=1 Tax=Shewanella pealeana (strain ATCC 700345 / ANG-SQ1) TaxID=398579 RepID=A8H8X4_SHEPA|nr:hypothetical protein [Shewanella pealeana]ABV89011.1 conserved hypothetical protein [Shewanella pealeana ATCC 700345]
MARRLTHWVLLISLLGQFLLTPAMALPDQLHQLEGHLPQSIVLSDIEANFVKNELAQNDVSATNKASSLFSLVAEIGEQVSASLCEASCQMLASGHCTSHSSCAPGLGPMCVLSLKQNISRGGIDGPSWSVKTVKLHIVTPPPIA